MKKSWQLNSFLILSLGFLVCINLNKASAQQLKKYLPLIGDVKAQKIISYRKLHHGFTSIYELEAVTGLGWRYLQKNLTIIESVFCKIV